MRLATVPALLATTLLVPSCFKDVDPGDTGAGETSIGDGDGDGEPGDGDGDPGDGDGDPGDGDGDLTGDGDGDGDGDDEPGDGDGEPGCQPGDCAANQYCIAGVCEDPPEGMVAIEAGPFWMGCNEEIDPDCNADEYPYHEVTLSAYAIDRKEVTSDQYAACVADGGCIESCGTTTGSLPVACMSWFDARDYCAWAGKVLPTEAQWEKAARGSDGRLYPWGNDEPTCTHLPLEGCGVEDLPPVGSYPAGASPYGVLDMLGGMVEWTADWYSPSYYVESPLQDPQGPNSGTERVLRGPLISVAPKELRISARGHAEPTVTFLTGIRCAYNPQ